jgi:hypothetical protein
MRGLIVETHALREAQLAKRGKFGAPARFPGLWVLLTPGPCFDSISYRGPSRAGPRVSVRELVVRQLVEAARRHVGEAEVHDWMKRCKSTGDEPVRQPGPSDQARCRRSRPAARKDLGIANLDQWQIAPRSTGGAWASP